MHRHRSLTLALAAALALTAAACGGEDDPIDAGGTATDAPTATDTPETSADATTPADTGAATVAVASTDLGDVLVDGEGFTLYVFDNDSGDSSACTGDCATNWPPVAGPATAGEGVDVSLLGTITRDDGSTQTTIDGRPLYRFAGDAAPGDTNGQAVGDVWWAVAPDGSAITGEAAADGPYDY